MAVTALRTLVRDERVNATLGWLLIGTTFLIAGWSLAVGNLLWSGFAAVCGLTTVVPPIVRRSPREMLPWELLALLAGAVVIGGFDVLVTPTGYVATAALALVVAVLVDIYTTVEMTSWFSVAFVVVTTTALAGVWGVTQFAADTVLGTTRLATNADMMWDFVLATAVGIVAGLLFELYFRRLGSRAGHRASLHHDPTRMDRVPITESWLRYPARGMQVTLLVVAGYGIATVNPPLAINATLSLGVSLVPAILRLRYEHPLSAGLTTFVTLAAFLHVVGSLGPYTDTSWWDTMTHTMTATLVAGVGYAAVQALDHLSLIHI